MPSTPVTGGQRDNRRLQPDRRRRRDHHPTGHRIERGPAGVARRGRRRRSNRDRRPQRYCGLPRGTDGALWWRRILPSGTTPWSSLGGGILGDPVPVTTSSGIDVFVRGLDSSVYWKHITGTVASPTPSAATRRSVGSRPARPPLPRSARRSTCSCAVGTARSTNRSSTATRRRGDPSAGSSRRTRRRPRRSRDGRRHGVRPRRRLGHVPTARGRRRHTGRLERARRRHHLQSGFHLRRHEHLRVRPRR